MKTLLRLLALAVLLAGVAVATTQFDGGDPLPECFPGQNCH